MEYIEVMDISYSYKPVFIRGFLENMDLDGRVVIDDLVVYFIEFYEDGR